MGRFAKDFVYGLKKYIVGLVIFIAIIFLFQNMAIKDMGNFIDGGKPQIESNYNLAFDKIKCCMTYNELRLILGEGTAIGWEAAFVGDKSGKPTGFVFYSGDYKIITNGVGSNDKTIFKESKLIQAQLVKIQNNEVLKRLNNCVC